MSRIWLLPVILLIHYSDGSLSEDPTPAIYEPSWVYRCLQDEGCQRSEHPHPSPSTTNTSGHLFESLDVCRTVCGRFGGLWPRPVTAALGMSTVKIHPKYLRFDLIDAPAETRETLVKMSKVITGNLLDECDGNVTDVATTPVVVFFTVKTDNLELTWDTDEQYMLDVNTREGKVNVHIVAETVYGARHALESFTHLISNSKPEFSESHQCSLLLISGAKIRDRPAYKHRGFLLDTSRNFIPMDSIKKMIDGMALTKMNVFHWHVTDSHSFPLASTRVPQFTRYGAYSAYEIYSTEEIRGLIEYARIRGVRVVIEIDAPAHSGNGWQWGKEYGLGELAVCVNSKNWRQLCMQPPCGQLNPANENTYKVLKDLYTDIAELVPKPALLHMGGDEVSVPCWNSSETVTNYMAEKGYERNTDGFIKLWGEFHEKTLKAWDESLESTGTKDQQPVMLWSSELTRPHRIQKYLDKNRYVIEVWEEQIDPLLTQLSRLGYRTVSVPKDVWYLDHGFWGATKFSNWRRMYSHTLPKHNNVLGGEVAMWTEYVDENALETRVWPRALAVGERLWSDPASGAAASEPRLQRARARLLARRLRAQALAPAWCAQHDTRCL